jgi:hypothetical protein
MNNDIFADIGMRSIAAPPVCAVPERSRAGIVRNAHHRRGLKIFSGGWKPMLRKPSVC